ncbi:MAG: RT0821/Lpp0805 family surface protein [Dongiaceae bacterium]
MKKLLLSLLVTVFVTACAEGAGPKQNIGTLLGAAGGAVVGHNIGGGRGQTAAIAIGTLLGAYAGSEIGKSLDAADRSYANRAAYSAFETGRSNQPVYWRNPDSGNSGSVTPIRTYNTDGQVCREYTQTIQVGGRSEQAYGTACRDDSGDWQIKS